MAGHPTNVKANLPCCPFCGGTSGYTYVRIERYAVTSGWDGNEEGQCDGVEKETKPRCIDCNKIIKQFAADRG